MKPLAIHIYTGDKQVEEFGCISQALKLVLPPHVYTLVRITPSILANRCSIDENCACLVICNTELIEEHASTLVNHYCNTKASKALFLCAGSSSKDVITKVKYVLTKLFGCPPGSWPSDNLFKKLLAEQNESKEAKLLLKPEDCCSTKFSYHLTVYKEKPDEKLMFCLQNDVSKEISAVLIDATAQQLTSSDTHFLAKAMQKLRFDSNINSACFTQVPELTSGFLICSEDSLFNEKAKFECDHLYGKDPELFFYKTTASDNNEKTKVPATTPTLFPIEVRSRSDGLPVGQFKSEKYFQALDTKNLGHILVFAPVCETSLTISRSLSIALPDVEGILVVPETQTRGRGRNSTYEWISPMYKIGCAMLTFNYIVALDSEFSKCLDFLEHVLAVSIVDAIKSLLKNQNFPLHIKWPNDIYYERRYKMGGVLVNVHKEEKNFVCIAGAGINVANSKPIGCINDRLPEEQKLSVEEVIAETMNKFEYYSSQFLKEGRKKFLEKYYQYWLHTNEEVLLMQKESESLEKVVIKGIDLMGNLEVLSKEDGHLYSLKDDNNSFDLAKGLIHPKT